MEERQIVPDSFYWNEDSEDQPICCDSCGDDILKNREYFNNGFPICDYCRIYILQKN